MNIVELKFGTVIVHAELDNSETALAFLALLPHKFQMSLYDEREYYAQLSQALPLDGQNIEDYQNGDFTFFPELNTLAIFFAKAGVSSQPGLIKMGKITTDLSDFLLLGESVECEMRIIT